MKIKTFSRFLLTAIMVVCAGYMLSACSSSTTPTTTPTTQNNVYPKQTSSYTYTKYQTDSNANKVPVSDITVVATVSDTGKLFFGQNNSYTITDNAYDTTHYAYSSSNDVPIYIENSGLSGILASVGNTIFQRWITLSVASKAKGVVVLDSLPITVLVSSIPIPAKVHLVTSYVGTDSVRVISGESLFVQHCQIIATATSDPSLLIKPQVTLTHVRDIYFAPKIGAIAKDSTWTDIPSALGLKGNKGGTVQVLTTYDLK